MSAEQLEVINESMNGYDVYVNSKTKYFWGIKQNSSSVCTGYGPLGRLSNHSCSQFDDPVTEVENRIKAKLKEGYKKMQKKDS